MTFNPVSQSESKHQKQGTSREIVNKLENSHKLVADTLKKSTLKLTDKMDGFLFYNTNVFLVMHVYCAKHQLIVSFAMELFHCHIYVSGTVLLWT